MSRDAALLGNLFAVTRGDLERAEFPFPTFGASGWRFLFLTLNRVSSFWKNQGDSARIPFEQCMEDFVSGLFNQKLTWALLVEAERQRINIRLGGEDNLGVDALKASLRGSFPDVRLGDTSVSRDLELSRFTHATQVTGCPTGKIETERGVTPDQVERLCRGLFGDRWAYIVMARPVDPPETTRQINEVAQEIRTSHETMMLKGSAVDEQDRLARQYVELLEAKLKRLQQARTGGMWTVGAYLLADSADVLVRGSALLTAAFSGDKSVPDPLRIRPCRKGAATGKPPEPLNSRELAILVAIPREEYPGYEVVEPVRFGVEMGQKSGAERVVIGDILDRGQPTGNRFEISRDSLTRHGLIVGVTGSGKTNTCFGLLDQIWDGGRGIPFLVIESAKSEYRTLLDESRFKGLRVFTLGDETVSPFRLNPFEVPPGILVQMHIDYLKALFAAAFVLYPPMPYVLEQSIQEAYQDRGWDLARNTNRRGAGTARAFPTLSNLHAKVSIVIERMGYGDEITMNVRSGLQARINQLRIGGGKGLMLDTRTSIPMEDLFGSPCVLELKQIVSDDEKAFLMGLILIRLYEQYESGRLPPKTGLRHVTLIEEAHRLLRNVSMDQGSEVSANPKGHAIEVFANILSEIRAYGEGVLIAEQVPVKLTPDAIKNTNLKITHRLLAEDDRRAIGGTIGLSEPQSRYLPSLPCGEAVAFAEGMRKPVLLSIPLAQAKGSRGTLPDHAVRTTMSSYWQQRANLRLRFDACFRCMLAGAAPACRHTDDVFEDWSAGQALHQLIGAMIHNKPMVMDAFTDLTLVLRRFTDSGNPPSPYCVLVRFFEDDLERRGVFYGWPYSEVEKAVALACSVAWSLTQGLGTTDRGALEKQIAQDLGAFADLMKRLCKRDRGPFPACTLCRAQCHFRFEVARLERDAPTHGSDFRAAFVDPRIQPDDLARFCWEATVPCFVEKDIITRRGAAFCFASQQLARLGLPTYSQQDVGRGLYERIERRVEQNG